MVEDLIDLKDGNNNAVENPEGADRYILRGPEGKSAYDLAVENGYSGTEQDFADLLINFKSDIEEAKKAAEPAKDNALQNYPNTFTAVQNFADVVNIVGNVTSSGNNAYEGVQTFNNVVVFNDTVTFGQDTTFNHNIKKYGESWTDDTVPNLGMNKVMLYFEKLEDDSYWTSDKTTQEANSEANISTTTNIIPDTSGAVQPLSATGLMDKGIVAYHCKVNTGAVYWMNLTGNGTESADCYAVPGHEWLLAADYDGNPIRFVEVYCGASVKGSKHLCLMQCDYVKVGNKHHVDIPRVFLWNSGTTKVNLVTGNYDDSQRQYLACTPMGQALPRFIELESWSDSRIYELSGQKPLINCVSKIKAFKGVNATSASVSVDCAIYNYNGHYEVQDPKNAVYYNVDAVNQYAEGYGVSYAIVKKNNTRWACWYSITDERPEVPSTLAYTSHQYKTPYNIPAAGCTIVIRLQAKRDYTDYFRYLNTNCRPAIESPESWMEQGYYYVDNSENANYHKWMPNSSITTNWFMEYGAGSSPDAFRYLAVSVPANDTGLEREAFVFAGMVGFEGHVLRIIQAAE